MSAITTLTIADGQAVPVNHTFTPHTPQVGNNSAVWLEKSATSPSGYWRIESSVIQNGRGVYKTRFTVSIPILASVPVGCCVDANTPVVSYKELFNGEFSSPPSSTSAQRKDLFAVTKNFLALPVALAAVVDLEMAW